MREQMNLTTRLQCWLILAVCMLKAKKHLYTQAGFIGFLNSLGIMRLPSQLSLKYLSLYSTRLELKINQKDVSTSIFYWRLSKNILNNLKQLLELSVQYMTLVFVVLQILIVMVNYQMRRLKA